MQPTTLEAARKVRLTGSLTAEERAHAAAAIVPSKPDQQRHLASLAEAIEAKSAGRLEP